MKTDPCDDATAHTRHEWYWKNILRRECPGKTKVDWDSVPLAGFCDHGVGMLDQCDGCEAARKSEPAAP